MKVVHVATTDFGGAFKAVQRIQESIRLYDVQSDILVRSRSFATDTIEVMNTPTRRLLSKMRNFLNLILSHGEIVTDQFGADLIRHPRIQEADVIVLHWVNSFISDRGIRRMAGLKKPVVWVMHDMWVFTGGCHYDGNCGRYKDMCGHCPFLGSRWGKDISYWNLKKKKELFEKTKVSFVAISRWEKECALLSMPLRGKSVTWISNPLNIDVFRPLNRRKLRQKYGIPDKKIILFGADKALENPTKGFQYLIEALRYLRGEEYHAVCFGKAPERQKLMAENVAIEYLGTVTDESVLAEWYNIADVFVAPSLQEGFGYTVCEALACGTPVAAFAVGGILDQIIHKENGYLAKLYDAEQLAEGIVFCAEHREQLGVKGREQVIDHNSYKVIGSQYTHLFQQLTCRL